MGYGLWFMVNGQVQRGLLDVMRFIAHRAKRAELAKLRNTLCKFWHLEMHGLVHREPIRVEDVLDYSSNRNGPKHALSVDANDLDFVRLTVELDLDVLLELGQQLRKHLVADRVVNHLCVLTAMDRPQLG